MGLYFFTRLLKPNDKTGKWSSPQIMIWVLIALIPGIAIQSHYFGLGNIIQIIFAISLAVLFEGIFLFFRKKSLTPLLDGSAIVTAVLLAISIPTYAPWWVITIGVFFAIVVTKQLYGGLGHNIFNPAMVGYVVLLISFPVQMTQWINPNVFTTVQLSLVDSARVIFNIIDLSSFSMDGITQATPLDKFKESFKAGMMTIDILNLLEIKTFAGEGWQQVNLAFLAGGIFLIMLRVIRWQLPFYFIFGLIIISFAASSFAPDSMPPVLFHLFSGATMLGAFFILTDPVSASTTPKGQIIYALIIALLVWLIRTFGNYPDAIAFSVLFANLCVPLIDYVTKPRVYGH
ncbi:electron transport complex subunit RsxD [Thorsellia anophelis]|uniref:Ion-translocating oxidoreductase complex subunit D n=1 Tax=Thorsellia anophelis DSM 18579 TaxID=1123402 RepID=A0A1I0CU86_9GAMM|nr:electron transport complex subunit RsxD [Thorsellia anophelis]SET22945.1 electron transport complex protein RnfD [Thorsellia anophelis DSM 18579]